MLNSKKKNGTLDMPNCAKDVKVRKNWKKDEEIRKLNEEIESIHERNASAFHTAMENHAAKKANKKLCRRE
jgi:hypothetical protein